MYRKISAVLALAAAGGIAVLLATGTAAGSAAKQERIAILLDFGSSPGTFQLTPLSSGPVRGDSGTVSACCWTNRNVTRDGQSASIDDPTLTFKSKRGTFSWHARVTYVDLNNDYTVATANWKITHGTGAYAHLEGHGRQAFVQKTAASQNLADKAEGIVTMGG